MDEAKLTPKDFFLWAGAIVALYWAVIAFIFLLFNYIDYAFPNTLNYLAANPYDSGIGNEMAAIIVMFPIYVVLMWLIRSDIARDTSRRDIWVRRWALILTLFVAGATIAGDLITLLATFFSGNELTIGFLLKSLILLLIAAVAFMHFIADYWGYWEANEARKRSVCYTVGLLAALAVVAGFVMFGTPFQARQYRFDEQRVMDLQGIQSRVVTYWQQKQKMPGALSDLNDAIAGYATPVDPETATQYVYKKLAGTTFELCATFDMTSQGNLPQAGRVVPSPVTTDGLLNNDNWIHGAGQTCFVRTIDTQRYPPAMKASTPAAR